MPMNTSSQDAKHQRAVPAGGQHLFELTAEACLVVESGDGVVGVRDVLTGDVILDVRFHAQKFQTIGNGFRPVAEDWLIGKYTVVGEHHISHGALGKKERAEIRHRARSFWIVNVGGHGDICRDRLCLCENTLQQLFLFGIGDLCSNDAEQGSFHITAPPFPPLYRICAEKSMKIYTKYPPNVQKIGFRICADMI